MARGFRRPQAPHAAILVRQDDGERWTPDVVVRVSVDESWEVPSHPVEEGISPSDHTRTQPASLTISVVLTENPTAGEFTGGRADLQRRVAWLRDTATAGQRIDIITTRLGTFTSYQIVNLPLVIDNVQRLAFDLQLQQVRVATSSTVLISVETTADDTATGAPDEVDTGEQATTTDTDEAAAEVDQSTLAALIDWV